MSTDQQLEFSHENQDPGQNDYFANRSTYVSVAVNIGLVIGQTLAGIISGSHGLIADGLHSLSDLVSDCVVLVARFYSKKDADKDHPYGHHRYENAASLFIGLLLLLVGIGMVFSAVRKIENPESLGEVKTIGLWAAMVSILAKELLFRYMLRVAEQIRSALLIANAWHARSDAASSLVAAFGIFGSLMGVPVLDIVAALIVGLIVCKMGWRFSWDALHDLMDKSGDENTLNLIRGVLAETEGVLGVHDLRSRKMADLLIIDVHLEVKQTKTVKEGHDIALNARERVMKRFPVLNVMTHIDPCP